MSTHTKRNARLIAFLVVIIIVAFGLTVSSINAQEAAKKPTIAAQKKAALAYYLNGSVSDSLTLKNSRYAASIIDTSARYSTNGEALPGQAGIEFKVYKGANRACPSGWTDLTKEIKNDEGCNVDSLLNIWTFCLSDSSKVPH